MELNSVQEIENTVIFEDVTSDSDIVSSDTETILQAIERMMKELADSDRELTVKRQAQRFFPLQEKKELKPTIKFEKYFKRLKEK